MVGSFAGIRERGRVFNGRIENTRKGEAAVLKGACVRVEGVRWLYDSTAVLRNVGRCKIEEMKK